METAIIHLIKQKSEDDGSESNDGKEFGNDIDDDF